MGRQKIGHGNRIFDAPAARASLVFAGASIEVVIISSRRLKIVIMLFLRFAQRT